MPATARCSTARAAREPRQIASTTKLMTALLAVDSCRWIARCGRCRYRAGASGVAHQPARRRAHVGRGPAARPAAAERQRRRRYAGRAARRARWSGFVDLMNAARAPARPEATPTSRTRSGWTTRRTTRARSTSRASRAGCCATDFLAATVDMPRGPAVERRAPADRGQPQPPRAGGAVGRRREDRPHRARPGTCWSAPRSRKGVQLVSVVLGAPSEAARDADTLGCCNYGCASTGARPCCGRAAVATRQVEYSATARWPACRRARVALTRAPRRAGADRGGRAGGARRAAGGRARVGT